MGMLWDIIQRHIDEAPYPPSERQLAARLGVSPTTIANWRDPKKLPDRANLEAIAALVGVRYAVVLEAALYDTGYHDASKVVPIRVRPITTVEAELRVALADRDDWDAQNLSGRDAESERQKLQARVDALEAELVSLRSAIGNGDSVAEL